MVKGEGNKYSMYKNKVGARGVLLLVALAVFPALDRGSSSSSRPSQGQADKGVQDLDQGDDRQRGPQGGDGVGYEAGEGGVEEGGEEDGEDMARGLRCGGRVDGHRV